MEQYKVSKPRSSDKQFATAAKRLEKLKYEGNSAYYHGDETEKVFEHTYVIARYCGIALCMYFIVGIGYLRFIDNSMATNIFDTFYFCVITLTTIGYGDVHPTNNSTKLFVSAYVFLGLMILSSAITGIVRYWRQEHMNIKKRLTLQQIDREERSLREALDIPYENEDSKREAVGEQDSIVMGIVTAPLLGNVAAVDALRQFLKVRLSVPAYAVPIILKMLGGFALILANVTFGTLFYSVVVDNHTVVDAIYLTAMTITTVGYGDVVPSSTSSQAFTVVYALVGTLVTGKALQTFHNAIDDYHRAHRSEVILKSQFDLNILFDMDTDGDEQVSKAEFIVYKLMHMNLVEPKVIASIERQFHVLDVDNNNALTVNDIVMMSSKVYIQPRVTDAMGDRKTGVWTTSIAPVRTKQNLTQVAPTVDEESEVNDTAEVSV
mmetsp:Transcript_26301/g.38992  ORF Transcript_26301/g.38992 Transcript_26301/m.38992 type:complete len:435 (+) Transcript_26301:88-1392(+)